MQRRRLIITCVVGVLLIILIFTIYRIDYIKSNPLSSYYQSQFKQDYKEQAAETESKTGIKNKKDTYEIYVASIKSQTKTIDVLRNLQIRNTIKFSLSISSAILIIGILLSFSLKDTKITYKK